MGEEPFLCPTCDHWEDCSIPHDVHYGEGGDQEEFGCIRHTSLPAAMTERDSLKALNAELLNVCWLAASEDFDQARIKAGIVIAKVEREKSNG